MDMCKNNQKIVLIFLFALLDYLAIVAAEQSAVFLRNFFFNATKLHISWLNFWVIFPALYIIFLNMRQLYSRRMPFYKEVEQIFYSCLYGTAALVFVLYVAQIAARTSRFFVLLFAVLVFLFIAILRYATKKYLIKKQLLQIPVLIIGGGKTAELIAQAISSDVGMGYKIVGLLEDNKVKSDILKQYPALGGFADVEQVIGKTCVKCAVIAAPGMEAEKLGWLIFKVQPLVNKLVVIPNLSGSPMSNVEVETMFYEKLLMLRLKNHLANRWNILLKTIFDYTLTILGILFILPILVLIALKIRFDSPGPIIYDGVRLGKNGKLFKCYKFRSMYTNGDEILEKYFQEHPDMYVEWKTYHKLENDPRVTKFGAFMRRTSLDELPQIFNVLLGDMSLVGPRPYLPEEKAEMGNFSKTVLIAKPGITGFWQTSGRSNVSFDERVKMDCWYICNWNLWMDVVILFKTFIVVLGRKGAY